MELPSTLKNLYRHWDNHTKSEGLIIPYNEIFKDEKLSEEMFWFIDERINIWKKKVLGDTPPFTENILLSKYRFCNIFREFDRQTIEFHTLLNPIRDTFSLWLLNMFYCRMVARTETIKNVGLLSFDKEKNKVVYKKLMEHSRPRFGTPYVFPISTILKSGTPTRELFITEYLPVIMNEVAEEILKWNKESVYEGTRKIILIFGYNLNFLWNEVLIDVAYQYPEYINLFDRFPVGPGSLPTMQKINKEKDPSFLVKELTKIQFDTGLAFNNKKLLLSAENWEGVGCEFRKYTNLKNGKGRKRIFRK
jgi:hypothetical protein